MPSSAPSFTRYVSPSTSIWSSADPAPPAPLNKNGVSTPKGRFPFVGSSALKVHIVSKLLRILQCARQNLGAARYSGDCCWIWSGTIFGDDGEVEGACDLGVDSAGSGKSECCGVCVREMHFEAGLV
ncbi:hypothetical protein EJ05DRAFT_30805 [Pseudovirgaria hyperparasitica]|uniref:Uncharacterized protein n=1 Tax=Pseudovirgaria hyperparasitica TaxID=470096 RepID=A0A6A6WM14_9PEZI|nr:uncharacterized protein EJ05DRAFT_30805 [Pseudovirgaria hyperparasitica]KAF2763244.1 hypothetical protein EJ05DRAFT_30805 [Pseudovirgaria hyperparasitica]